MAVDAGVELARVPRRPPLVGFAARILDGPGGSSGPRSPSNVGLYDMPAKELSRRTARTIKATHEPSTPGATDTKDAVLSLSIDGDGTASQGVFLDAPLGTTGKLLNIRNGGREVLVLPPDGTLELHRQLVTLP
jgi:hypothetical protein